MNMQKTEAVLAATLAIIAVFLLGGISSTLFPSETLPTAQPSLSTVPSSILGSLEPLLPANNSSLHQIVGDFSLNSTSSNSSIYSYAPVGGLAYLTVSMAEPVDIITIESNGAINSTTAPIQQNGNVYKLTGDLTNQTLIINQSNTVIDGAGHSLQGYNNGFAYALENFDLQDVHNVTIKNFNISASWQGIWIQNCSNIVIENNSLSNINTGIDVNSANNTVISDNTFNNMSSGVLFSSWYGFGPSVNNNISYNNITDATTGIQMNFANSNVVTNNIIVNSYDPIFAGDNSTVAQNILINGIDAVSISSNNKIYGNSIFNFSESGLLLSGTNSAIYQNTIANCRNAVFISGSSDAYPLGNNTLYENNFVNNSQSLLLLGNGSLSVNYWDNGKEGNYWSSYNGTEVNGDGIGDTPYVLGGNNTDRYPLTHPYAAAVSQPTAIVDYSTGQLFFTLAIITAAAGALASFCLYVKFRAPTKPQTSVDTE